MAYMALSLRVNPFQPSVVFHIEISHLFCKAKQVTGFYIKCNTGLKWVNRHWQSLGILVSFLKMFVIFFIFFVKLRAV